MNDREASLSRLQRETFDLAVIGGGIYGAWIAWEAARTGLKTALIEKKDWGSGTSQSSSKLIHGGLRYLEHFEFSLVKKSLRERKNLWENGPHRIRPLKFFVPHYRWFRVPPWKMKIGLMLYDFLAGKGQPVTKHRYYSRDFFLKEHSFLKTEDILTGFSYGDCWTDDSRYTFEVVTGSRKAGAVALSYCQAEEYLESDGKIQGIHCRDRLNGNTFILKARHVMNCGGPWCESLSSGTTPREVREPFATGIMQEPAGGRNAREPNYERPTFDSNNKPEHHRHENRGLRRNYTRLTKGVHLVMPALPTRNAFLIFAKRDGRVFFLIPWYKRTLLGTTDTPFTGDPDSLSVTGEDMDYLLEEANAILKDRQWSRKDIQGTFAGLRTLENTEGKPGDISREWGWQSPGKNLTLAIGGKLTSARADAHRFVQWLSNRLKHQKPSLKNSGVGRPNKKTSPTLPGAAKPPDLPWKPAAPLGEFEQAAVRRGTSLGLTEDQCLWAAMRYGTQIDPFFDLISKNPNATTPLVEGLPFCYGDLTFCAGREDVYFLEDLLRRRIPLMLLSRLNREQVERMAKYVAADLSWSPRRCAEEVNTLWEKYLESTALYTNPTSKPGAL